jgi:adenylate kinase family enzyme
MNQDSKLVHKLPKSTLMPARYLNYLERIINANTANQKASILIVGPGRSGKSSLAKSFAKIFDYNMLHLDAVRPLYYAIECDYERALTRDGIYMQIADRLSTGCIIEGLDIVLPSASDSNRRPPLSFDMVDYFASEYHVGVLCLGYGTTVSLNDKSNCIKQWASRNSCYTRDWSQHQLDKYLEYGALVSLKLKEHCLLCGYTYAELCGQDFCDPMANPLLSELIQWL